jgi:hypothetical protein
MGPACGGPGGRRTLERPVVDLVLERPLLGVELDADLVGGGIAAGGGHLGGELRLERALPGKARA